MPSSSRNNKYQVHYHKGTKAMGIKTFDGNLFCCINDSDIYAPEALPEHEKKSKELDAGSCGQYFNHR